MTRDYWTDQFDFTRILPDFRDCLDRMERRSAGVSLPLERLPYGPHPRQHVELAGRPGTGDILPVFIHGGYWRALTAQGHRFVLPALAGAGGAVANLEYRLMPEVSLDEIVGDTLAGLRLLAERFGCHLCVVGHSAGGHLAVTGALRLPDHVASAVAISGLYDLAPLQWSFLREEVGLTATDLAGHSPQALWQGHDAHHVTVAVGADETPEFHRQGQVFAASHGARMLTVPGAHHMTVLDALADPDGSFAREVHARIDPDNTTPGGDDR